MWCRGYIPQRCNFAEGWNREGYCQAFYDKSPLPAFDSYDSLVASLDSVNVAVGKKDSIFVKNVGGEKQLFTRDDEWNMRDLFVGQSAYQGQRNGGVSTLITVEKSGGRKGKGKKRAGRSKEDVESEVTSVVAAIKSTDSSAPTKARSATMLPASVTGAPVSDPRVDKLLQLLQSIV
jgi:hypothetical protein